MTPILTYPTLLAPNSLRISRVPKSPAARQAHCTKGFRTRFKPPTHPPNCSRLPPAGSPARSQAAPPPSTGPPAAGPAPRRPASPPGLHTRPGPLTGKVAWCGGPLLRVRRSPLAGGLGSWCLSPGAPPGYRPPPPTAGSSTAVSSRSRSRHRRRPCSAAIAVRRLPEMAPPPPVKSRDSCRKTADQ